jgi:hypothetical protein
LFGVLLALLVVGCIEAMLQLFYYQSAGAFLFQRALPPLYEPDPTRCYRLKPNLDFSMRTNEFSTRIYTNAQGMRTDAQRLDVPRQKAPDAFRILFLGPSFAFGWGNDWEDSYPALIAEGLELPGRRVEIMNLGVPGQPQAPQLCWLRSEGRHFSPDAVVATVYGARVPPLPSECPTELECPYVGDDGRIYARRPTAGRRLASLTKNLATVFYGFYVYQALRPKTPAANPQAGKELYPEGEWRTDLALEEIAEGYEHYVDFVQQQLGADTPVAFLHVPLSYVVHPEHTGRWSHLREASTADARTRIQAGIEAVRARDLTIIDTTPDLVAAADREPLYYWLDIHLTPAGNGVVAEAALPQIQSLLAGD